MLILGIDTSSSVAAVALLLDDKVIGETSINHIKTHSQKLMPIIDQLLKNVEVQIKDIDLIAVTVGPGSFTGVRIGISVAKGFAHPYKIPVVEVSSIEGLAYNTHLSTSIVCPLIDARRNQVYSAGYVWQGDVLENILNEDQYMIDEILDQLIEVKKSTGHNKVTFVGDGVLVHRDLIVEKLGESAEFSNPASLMQRGTSVALLGRLNAKDAVTYDQVHANYIRKSQAEREYDERHEK